MTILQRNYRISPSDKVDKVDKGPFIVEPFSCETESYFENAQEFFNSISFDNILLQFDPRQNIFSQENEVMAFENDLNSVLSSSAYITPSSVSPSSSLYSVFSDEPYIDPSFPLPSSCSPAELSHPLPFEEEKIAVEPAKPYIAKPHIAKPHICSDCNKGFSRRYNLQQHEKTHSTEEKPFLCDWDNCPKRFIRSADLERHKRIHSGDKPFLCRHGCVESFSRTEARRRHEKKAHGIEESYSYSRSHKHNHSHNYSYRHSHRSYPY